MSKLPSSTNDIGTLAWLGQFSPGDRLLAKQLLDAFVLVSRDDFIEHMREMLIAQADRLDGPVALYAERELRHRYGVPHRLFKETRTPPRRACGAAGPPAVKPTKAYDPSVGSEGIVAQMISELCREFPKRFLDHPGPDQIRRKRARAFWVVTDLIGSGHRARRYLEAAWRVRSVRSWWSGKLVKFGVMAYAATESGEQYVSRHPCQAEVHFVIPCPTIETVFSKTHAEKMKRLCTAYDPTLEETHKNPWAFHAPSLGYGSAGAMLVFAHGAPNNVPLMFHKASRNKATTWTPLFPSRVTAGISKDAFGIGLTVERIEARLSNLGQQNLARSKAVINPHLPTSVIFLVLAALSRPPRLNDRVLAARTRLPSHELSKLLRAIARYGWVDSQRRLTDQGAAQLAHARKQLQLATDVAPVGKSDPEPYYPSSLRRPI
ncbi:phosphoribosyltransferase-like protein [Pseudomonas inefficax]|uniref:phosphoribosyltransferase-like protein n=1 Tax=Pseudomonas inefficax TaxID=2078786 RepID=UPI004046ACA5